MWTICNCSALKSLARRMLWLLNGRVRLKSLTKMSLQQVAVQGARMTLGRSAKSVSSTTRGMMQTATTGRTARSSARSSGTSLRSIWCLGLRSPRWRPSLIKWSSHIGNGRRPRCVQWECVWHQSRSSSCSCRSCLRSLSRYTSHEWQTWWPILWWRAVGVAPVRASMEALP